MASVLLFTIVVLRSIFISSTIFVATKWDRNIIRAKGVCYFSNNPDMSFLFEQAGVQKKLKEAGLWYATAPERRIDGSDAPGTGLAA